MKNGKKVELITLTIKSFEDLGLVDGYYKSRYVLSDGKETITETLAKHINTATPFQGNRFGGGALGLRMELELMQLNGVSVDEYGRFVSQLP